MATHKPDTEWAHMRGLGASHQGIPTVWGRVCPLLPSLTHPCPSRAQWLGPHTRHADISRSLPSFLYQELRTKQGSPGPGAWEEGASQAPSRVTPPVLLDRLTPRGSPMWSESGSSSCNSCGQGEKLGHTLGRPQTQPRDKAIPALRSLGEGPLLPLSKASSRKKLRTGMLILFNQVLLLQVLQGCVGDTVEGGREGWS